MVIQFLSAIPGVEGARRFVQRINIYTYPERAMLNEPTRQQTK
jgi:hypothetical protein